jgi:lipoprotein NlpI
MRAWQAGRTGAAGALAAAFLDHAPCGFATEHEGLVGVPRAASSPDAIAVAPSATVVAQLNDLGFFLTESGDAERGLSVLEFVTTLAPDRTVAWLNQADAAWASGDKGLARASYRTYVDRLEDAGGTAVPRATKRAARR